MKILITGGLSGIGFDTALTLAKKGHYIYLTVHKTEQIKTAKEKIKMYNLNNIEVLDLDISSKLDRNKVRNLDIDCLFNNAAIGVGGSLICLDVDKIRENFEVNFFSTLDLTKQVILTWIENQKRGTIVTMSSLAGLLPIPFLGSYSASKAALLTFFTSLRRELVLLKVPIRIKLIEPGLYKTGFNDFLIDSGKDLCNQELLLRFENRYNSVIELEHAIINLLECTYTDSIVKKIVKAIESKNNRFIYRSPFLQVIATKFYMFLFK